MNDQDYVQENANKCYSWTALYRLVNNGKGANARTLKRFKEKYAFIDTSHFTRNGKKNCVELITCPVCGGIFKWSTASKKKKVTCSHACSNTYFRSGINNPKTLTSPMAPFCLECIIDLLISYLMVYLERLSKKESVCRKWREVSHP